MPRFFDVGILSDDEIEKECECNGGISNQSRYNDYRNRLPFHYIEDGETDGYYYWTFGATMELCIELSNEIACGEDSCNTSIEVDSELSDTSINPVENRVITAALNSKIDLNTEKTLLDQAYVKSSEGTLKMVDISEDPLNMALTRYDLFGRLKVNEAVLPNQAVNLGQMDKAIGKAVDEHESTINIENSSGVYSLRQKYKVDNLDYGAVASGENAVALGGKRYDMLDDITRTATSAEGNQSFAAGASVHAYGDFSAALGKDTKAYQKGSFAAGGGTQSGMTEAEFNDYYWDSTNNIPLHNGKGKDADGNILDTVRYKYSESYSASATFGEDNKSIGRALFTVGQSNRNIGSCNSVGGKTNNVDGIVDIVHGESTDVTGDSNSVFANNSDIKANNVFAAGNALTGNYDNQILLGSLNENSEKNLLEVGGGQPILRIISFKADFTSSDEIIIKPYYPSKPCTICISNVAINNYSFIAKNIIALSGNQYFGIKTIDGRKYTSVNNVFTSNPLVIKPERPGDTISIYCYTLQDRSASGNYQNFGVYVRHNSTDTYKADILNSYVNSQKNAFEVLWDGRAKVRTAPKDNDDVVRFEELKTAESKLNENIIKDPNKTYIVFNGSEVTLNATIEASVDWGDGSNETIDGKRGHVYNDNVTYHLISITNITEFKSGIITPQSGVIKIKLSDKIKSITTTDSYPGLIRVDFPDYLYTIGGSCLAWSTSLQEIRLGYSIQSIDSNAFFGCTNLSKVYIKTTTPPAVGISIFGNTPLQKIIVPKGSIYAYKTADGWKNWADRIVYEVDSSDVDLKLNKLPVNTFGSNKVVYGWEPTNSTATAGNVTSYKLSSDTSENSIAYRDSNGRLQAAAGATADDAATFGQLESTSNALQANIDKKIDLVESDTTIALKNNSTISYTSSATASTIMQRDSNGRVKVEDGINNKDAVNRGQLDTKLDLTGGTLTGDLTIQDANVEITKTSDGKGNLTVGGNLRVNGTTTTVDTETLSVKDNLIVTNSNNTELVNLSGLAIKTGNKDVDENAIAYGILYDPATSADSVKLGLGSINKTTNEFTFKTAADANPVATRDNSTKLTDNHLLVWNSTKHTLIDANNLVDSITPASLGLNNFILDGGEIVA